MASTLRTIAFALPFVFAVSSLVGCAGSNTTSSAGDVPLKFAPTVGISGVEPPSAPRAPDYNPHARERYTSQREATPNATGFRGPRPPR